MSTSISTSTSTYSKYIGRTRFYAYSRIRSCFTMLLLCLSTCLPLVSTRSDIFRLRLHSGSTTWFDLSFRCSIFRPTCFSFIYYICKYLRSFGQRVGPLSVKGFSIRTWSIILHFVSLIIVPRFLLSVSVYIVQ
jgi:hypothetical protein